MAPIDKLSDIRRLPRLGKIRLGIKKEGHGTTYPQAVDYFVCPDEVKALYGDQPKELPVMFPADDIELVAPQWYKCYSYTHGLICKGDGKTCRRKVDTGSGDFANKDTTEWELVESVCDPEHCEKIGAKQCRRMMSLLFILQEVPGLGVYQLDTSSFYSIVNLNSQLAPDGFIRQFTKGRIRFLPLILYVSPQVVTPPGQGRKTVTVLNIRADVKLTDIIQISRQGPAQVLLPTLEEEEPPEDLFPEEVISEEEPQPEAAPPEEEKPKPKRKKKAAEIDNPQDEHSHEMIEDPDKVISWDCPTMNAVYQLCWKFWKMQPSEVCKAVGYSTTMDIIESKMKPWEVWLWIKDMKKPKEPENGDTAATS